MKYRELRRRLTELEGDRSLPSAHSRAVYFDKYDRGIGINADRWNIVARPDGIHEVGFLERDDFNRFGEFNTEEECCDWLYAELTKPVAYHYLPEAEIAARMAKFRERMDAERATWPTWADVEDGKDGA